LIGGDIDWRADVDGVIGGDHVDSVGTDGEGIGAADDHRISQIEEDETFDAQIAAEGVVEVTAEGGECDVVDGCGRQVRNPIGGVGPVRRSCPGPEEDVGGSVVADIIDGEFGRAGGEWAVASGRDDASPGGGCVVDFAAENCPFGAVRNGG